MEKIHFMNLVFRGLTKDCLFRESSELKIVVTVNAEFIVLANEDEKFKSIICDNYSTFDGQIPFVLAKLKFPNVEIEKISGSDLIYDICANAKQFNKRVYLLGGYPVSNQGAVSVIRERYGVEIEGYSPEYQPYPFSTSQNLLIKEKLKEFKPHYLLAGFGARKQEFWINEHKEFLEEIGVELAVGVGGTFEFVSGYIKRAPRLLQTIGLEGWYRLFQEPRLFRLKKVLIRFKMFKYIFDDV